MRLAICLLTADRSSYTSMTLFNLKEKGRIPSDAILLHADDGSVTTANRKLAKDAGFQTVSLSEKRIGQGAHLCRMWNMARRMGATHILHLENDWQCVSPLDLSILMAENPAFDTVRLYGEYKEVDHSGPRAPTGKHIIGTKEVIEWNDLVTPVSGGAWQYGVASWGGPPSITKVEKLCEGGLFVTIKEKSLRLPRLHTARPVENIFWHFGTDQTPNFNGGRA